MVAITDRLIYLPLHAYGPWSETRETWQNQHIKIEHTYRISYTGARISYTGAQTSDVIAMRQELKPLFDRSTLFSWNVFLIVPSTNTPSLRTLTSDEGSASYLYFITSYEIELIWLAVICLSNTHTHARPHTYTHDKSLSPTVLHFNSLQWGFAHTVHMSHSVFKYFHRLYSLTLTHTWPYAQGDDRMIVQMADWSNILHMGR